MEETEMFEEQSTKEQALVPFHGHWVKPSEVAALTISKESLGGPSYKARYYLHVVLRSGERLSTYWIGSQYPPKNEDPAIDKREIEMKKFANLLNGLNDEE